MAGFDFVKMLEYIQRYRITSLTMVPPIALALAKHPLARKYDLSSITGMGCGAAPLGREVCEEVEKLIPTGSTVRQGWGMTETTCTCMSWHPLSEMGPSSGVGEMMPNCAARLMSLDGKTAIEKANERGELWVTGPNLMRRYWRRPQATADTMHVDADGTRWLKTGDIAYVEAYRPGTIFHVVDRLKELIKVKGNQVAPAELEAVLLENPAVVDVAVIGVTINGGEVPRAYVVRDPRSPEVTEEDIARWLVPKVANFKQLRGGVMFIDAIPKNPVGSFGGGRWLRQIEANAWYSRERSSGHTFANARRRRWRVSGRNCLEVWVVDGDTMSQFALLRVWKDLLALERGLFTNETYHGAQPGLGLWGVGDV